MADLEHKVTKAGKRRQRVCLPAGGLSLFVVLKHHSTVNSPTAGHYRYPCFSEVCLMRHFAFTKDFKVVRFHQLNSKRIFTLRGKGERKSFQCSFFQWVLREAACPGAMRATPELLSQHHTQPLHQPALAWSCVCERLCFTFICFVLPWATRVLMCQKSLREIIFGVWKC